MKNIASASLLATCFLFISCKTEHEIGPISEWGNFVVEISILEGEESRLLDQQKSAKQSWIHFGGKLHGYANQGSTADVLLLAKDLKKGESVEFNPIGVFKVQVDGKVRLWVVGSPLDEKKALFAMDTFFDLQKSCLSCKFELEKWVQKQLPGAIYLGWEDEIGADKWLRSVLHTP